MQDDIQPNWENIARREMATGFRSFFTGEVTPQVHTVNRGIREGDDVSDEFWVMVSRFDEYTEHVADDLQQISVLDPDSPKHQLFNLVQFIHSSFLALGRYIENDEVGDGLDCSNFEHARHILADAEELIDELEAEHGVDSDAQSEGDDEDE